MGGRRQDKEDSDTRSVVQAMLTSFYCAFVRCCQITAMLLQSQLLSVLSTRALLLSALMLPIPLYNFPNRPVQPN